jgi:predicted Zn-dependent protease
MQSRFERVLGVVDVDIFVSELNYVLGKLTHGQGCLDFAV